MVDGRSLLPQNIHEVITYSTLYYPSKANKNTEQRTVIQMYRLQHAQANKSCDYNDDFYRALLIQWPF